MAIHQFLAMVAILLLLGVFSSKLSSRFNVPILLMFLSVGMLTGSDGLDWVSINFTCLRQCHFQSIDIAYP